MARWHRSSHQVLWAPPGLPVHLWASQSRPISQCSQSRHIHIHLLLAQLDGPRPLGGSAAGVDGGGIRYNISSERNGDEDQAPSKTCEVYHCSIFFHILPLGVHEVPMVAIAEDYSFSCRKQAAAFGSGVPSKQTETDHLEEVPVDLLPSSSAHTETPEFTWEFLLIQLRGEGSSRCQCLSPNASQTARSLRSVWRLSPCLRVCRVCRVCTSQPGQPSPRTNPLLEVRTAAGLTRSPSGLFF